MRGNEIKISLIIVTVTFFLVVSMIQTIEAKTTKILFDNNSIETIIEYPESVVAGKKFTLSFLVNNKASIEKENITVLVDGQSIFIPSSENEIQILRLSGYGSIGKTIDFEISPNATIGIQYMNLYFLKNETDSERFFNTALPIHITERPKLAIRTTTPDSIFTDAEFPFAVEIEGLGTSLSDVAVQIIPPKEINFRGETMHTFSFIEANTPVTMRSQLVTTGQGEVGIEHYLPFQIVVTYNDEIGEKQTESKTVSILLRPRTLFEWGSDGGLWIGGVFLAPTVSIGTFVGAPLGALFTYLLKRHRKNKLRKL